MLPKPDFCKNAWEVENVYAEVLYSLLAPPFILVLKVYDIFSYNEQLQPTGYLSTACLHTDYSVYYAINIDILMNHDCIDEL